MNIDSTGQAMIDKALHFILGELNNYMDLGAPGGEAAVVLGALASPEGGAPPEIRNKLVLSLVNLERETAIGSTGFVARQGSAFGQTNPTLYLNLFVLLSAAFHNTTAVPNNYLTGLAQLSKAMGFFQGKWGFDPQNSAALPAGMSQISMEMVSLTMAELSTLWAVLGANYLPSVVYKLRMITFQQDWLIAPIPDVGATSATLARGGP